MLHAFKNSGPDRLWFDKELVDKFVSSLEAANVQTDRETLFAYLVGSQNYGVTTKDSDVDIKVFGFPTDFELYKGGLRGEKANIVELKYGEVEFHDFRDIPELIRKMNPTYLEMFYTSMISNDYDESFVVAMKNIDNLLPDLFNEQREIFRSSVAGTFFTRLKTMQNMSKDPTKEREFLKSAALCARMLCYNKLVIIDPLDASKGLDRSVEFGKALHLSDPKCSHYKEAVKAFKIDGNLQKGLDEIMLTLTNPVMLDFPKISSKADLMEDLDKIGVSEFKIGKEENPKIPNSGAKSAADKIDDEMFSYFSRKLYDIQEQNAAGDPGDDDSCDDDYDDDCCDTLESI